MHPADSAFWIVSAFLGGVFVGGQSGSVALVFLIVLIGLCLFRKIWSISWPVFLCAAFVFFLGIIYYRVYGEFRSVRTHIPHEKAFRFEGIVRNDPRETERSQRFVLTLLPPWQGEVFIVTNPFPRYSYGDMIRGEGKAQSGIPIRGGFAEISIVFPVIEKTGEHKGAWIKEVLLGLKHSFVGVFRLLFARDAALFMSGVTFGDRSDFSPSLVNDMTRSGTTHMVALSGYNISVIAVVMYGVFGYVFSRRTTFYLVIVTLVGFVIMVGGEASIVRAAIMGCIALLAREAGRTRSVRNAIAFSAIVMAVYDPSVLRFDIGFQLSFVSLLGVVYLAPILEKYVKRRSLGIKTKELDAGIFAWREAVPLAIAAQIAVLPLLLFYFNEFSLTSLFANVLIVWLVPITMALGFIIALVGVVFFPIAYILSLGAGLLLSYELFVIRIFSHAALPVRGQLPIVAAILYYIAIVAYIYFERSREDDAKI